jgi:hypothetical protein
MTKRNFMPVALALTAAGATLAQTASLPLPGAFPYQLTNGGGAIWWVDPHRRGVFRVETRATPRADRLARLPHHPVAVAVSGQTAWIGVQAEPVD